jgi:nitrogenase molybdenum-iron protein alpha/beta subunit
MVVAGVSFLELTGEDFAGAVKAAAATVPFPIDYLRSRGFDGDLYQGYGEVVGRVLRRIPFRAQRPRPGKVAVAGFVFDRYEPDVLADLGQLRRLLGALGLEPGPFLLGGGTFAELLGAADSGRIVCLPHARAIPAKDLEGLGRPLVRTGLPVGFAGTTRWLRDVAAGCAVAKPVVEGVVRRAMEQIRPGLLQIRRRFRNDGRRAAIFAETPLAAALAVLTEELGIPPVLVGLRDDSFGGAAAFRRDAAHVGVELPGDLRVLANPPLYLARSELRRLAEDGCLRVVLGSAQELALLERPAGVATVELGFPRVSFHPREPSPTWGFAGAQFLCRRILEQL